MAKIVSVASGKGGVGKSVIAANVGCVLAQRGKRVVMADLDLGGADLHILFGLTNPTYTLTDFLTHKVRSLEEVIQPVGTRLGLYIIPGTGETLAMANLSFSRKKRLIRHLKNVSADVIIIDVGAGTSYHVLDFFLMADHYLAVATADPTAVLDLYRFIKLAGIRRVLGEFLARDPMADMLSKQEFTSVEHVLEETEKMDSGSRELATMALQGFSPALVLNRMTSRWRVNTLQLKKLLREYVGGNLVVLGEIPDDPEMERAVRTYMPVVEGAAHSPSAQAFQGIVDELLKQFEGSSPPT